MPMTVITLIAAIIAAAAVSAFIVYAIYSSGNKSLERELQAKDAEIRILQTRIETQEEAHKRVETEIRLSGEKALEEVKRTHAETLEKQNFFHDNRRPGEGYQEHEGSLRIQQEDTVGNFFRDEGKSGQRHKES